LKPIGLYVNHIARPFKQRMAQDSHGARDRHGVSLEPLYRSVRSNLQLRRLAKTQMSVREQDAKKWAPVFRILLSL
jgi:hypothetical protein